MSLARKILGNTAIQFFGRFGAALIALLITKILTDYFSEADYGRYTLIYEILAFGGALADFGIFTIALREMSRHGNRSKIIFGNAASLRLITGGVFLVLIFLVSLGLLFVPKYSGTVIPLGLSLAAFSTLFVILSGTFSAPLQYKMRTELSAFAIVVGKFLMLAFIFLLVKTTFPESSEMSFYAIIVAGTTSTLITFIMTYFFARWIFPFSFRYQATEIKKLFWEAAPFGIALALNVAYLKIDVILLNVLLPTPNMNDECLVKFCGDIENGRYGLAIRIMDILYMIPIYFMNSVLPSLSERLQKKQEEEKELSHSIRTREHTPLFAKNDSNIQHLLKNALTFLLTLGFSAGILLVLLGREIAAIVNSRGNLLSNLEHAGADTALQILGFLIPIAFCSFFFGFLLIATGHQKKLIWINIFAVCFNILANIIAIPMYGFVGAATTSVMSEFVMLSLMISFSMKVQKVSLSILTLGKIIFAATISGILFFALKYFFIGTGSGTLENILIVVGISFGFGIVYFGLLYFFGIVNREILRNVLKKEN